MCESKGCGWRFEVPVPSRTYLPPCCDRCGAPSQDLPLVVEEGMPLPEPRPKRRPR